MKNLTPTPVIAQNQSAGNKPAGHSTPNNLGEKSPRLIAAFLCASFCAPFWRISIMVARGGQAKAWPVPRPGVENPSRAAARLSQQSGGGYSISSLGVSV